MVDLGRKKLLACKKEDTGKTWPYHPLLISLCRAFLLSSCERKADYDLQQQKKTYLSHLARQHLINSLMFHNETFSISLTDLQKEVRTHSFKQSIKQTKLFNNKKPYFPKKKSSRKKNDIKENETRKKQQLSAHSTQITNKLLLVQWSYYKWTTLICFNQLLGVLLIFLFILLICRCPWQQQDVIMNS